MKIKFKKNKIIYGQDHRIYKGIPSEIEFDIIPFTNDMVKLVSIGYGDKVEYGNGALYVCIKNLPKNYQRIIL